MSDNENNKKRILILDDEPGILRVIDIKLRMAGYSVITANTGQAALQFAVEAKPDVMVLDLLLPDIDGFRVLKKLRTISALPVLVLTAKSDISHTAMDLGANDHMAKPFNPDELVRRIEALLES